MRTVEERQDYAVPAEIREREQQAARVERRTRVPYVWGVLRIGLGWIFLWAFLDKLFGLGFATEVDSAWLAGGSPTFGFLNFGTAGPLAGGYQALAGNPVVDWLFMLGLLGVGLSLMLGMVVRLGAIAGAAMLAMMYTAVLPAEHNPVLDDHIIYIIALAGLAAANAGDYVGLGRWWAKTKLVRRLPILR